MEKLVKLFNKDERIVIGLMSGTSVDGIDVAVVKISGGSTNSKVSLLHFDNFPYDCDIKKDIFKLFDREKCTVDYLCHMNFLLGEIFAKAVMDEIEKAGLKIEDVDLIGSHGQTVYHIPKEIEHHGYKIKSTLQIGEPSIIAERTGIVTVADFRTRDVAAGGQGAPLVPYTEYILYRETDKGIGLQNIGGIGNITVIPANCEMEDVYAFDNGPGNMVIDEVVKRITNGEKSIDYGGRIAAEGNVNCDLLNYLMEDKYFNIEPPKTTGREYFGYEFTNRLMDKAKKLNINDYDIVATATALTATAISHSVFKYIIPKSGLDKLIIGGGGSYNKTLINMIKNNLKDIEVLTQEDIGLNSDAKEAIAFALLANETINGNSNNVPKATGASKKVILGKIIV